MVGAADRVREALQAASEAEWEAGRDWYREAKRAAARIANRRGSDVVTVCGIIAALSPRLRWRLNLEAADRCATRGSRGAVLRSNWRLACAIRDGAADPFEALRAKRLAFLSNLVDPDGSQDVTVDTHAASVIYPDRVERELALQRVGVYDAIAEAYRAVACEVGMLPSEVQAVVWCHVRGGAS